MSYTVLSFNQRFGINIVSEDNKTIIHHKVATHVLCPYEQDTSVSTHTKQQQLTQNPPGHALSSHHQNLTSTAGPSDMFNFNDQGPTVGGQCHPVRVMNTSW
jgi:hypothetical protein